MSEVVDSKCLHNLPLHLGCVATLPENTLSSEQARCCPAWVWRWDHEMIRTTDNRQSPVLLQPSRTAVLIDSIVENIGQCGRLSQLSWAHFNIVTYLLTECCVWLNTRSQQDTFSAVHSVHVSRSLDDCQLNGPWFMFVYQAPETSLVPTLTWKVFQRLLCSIFFQQIKILISTRYSVLSDMFKNIVVTSDNI